MLDVRDLVPRIESGGLAIVDDQAEYEGICISIERLGRVLQVGCGHRTRDFRDEPAGMEPAGQSQSDATVPSFTAAGEPTRSDRVAPGRNRAGTGD